MPLEKRVVAAEAFWREEDAPDIDVQRTEAVVAIARRLKFRPKSVMTQPLERRARQLAQIADVSDAIATRAIIAYHFTAARPLMAAFLDAMGIPHENGLITDEKAQTPDPARLPAAVAALRSSFAEADVDLYLRTLAALDHDSWSCLEGILGTSV